MHITKRCVHVPWIQTELKKNDITIDLIVRMRKYVQIARVNILNDFLLWIMCLRVFLSHQNDCLMRSDRQNGRQAIWKVRAQLHARQGSTRYFIDMLKTEHTKAIIILLKDWITAISKLMSTTCRTCFSIVVCVPLAYKNCRHRI